MPDPQKPVPTRALRSRLLRWYDAEVRPLPWRRDRNSYRVWVAEVMLQQTRIAVVIPAFERFIAAFPSIAVLASADEELVLSLWSGLGYYSRARALHRAARLRHGDGAVNFPDSYDDARALPGVGGYTAAAVLSIAYGQPYAAVDGNVVRVLSRLFRTAESAVAPYEAMAQRLLDRRRPGDWNQAVMELGETICLPKTPLCAQCPLARFCLAHQFGETDRFPPPRARLPRQKLALRVSLLRDSAGRLLLQRGQFPYLPHLWLPPIAVLSQGPTRVDFRHAILHRDFEVEVFTGRLGKPHRALLGQDNVRLVGPAELHNLGRSSLLTKALRHADATNHPPRRLGDAEN